MITRCVLYIGGDKAITGFVVYGTHKRAVTIKTGRAHYYRMYKSGGGHQW